MAGYVIHLAIGEEYLRKHNQDITNKEEFLKGIIKPDQTADKVKSHYGDKTSIDSLKKFLDINKEKMNENFIKGYFLHLFTDYIFYGKYFVASPALMYREYDVTNKNIIEKYKIAIPNEVKKYAEYVEGEPQYLKYDLLYKIIDNITEDDIDTIIKKVKKGDYDEYKN